MSVVTWLSTVEAARSGDATLKAARCDSAGRQEVVAVGGSSSPPAGKWSALGSPVTLIAGTALNALANNTNVLGSAYDNSLAANRYQLAKVTLDVRGASAFTASAFVKVWLLPLTGNGTDYEDGAVGTTPARDPDIEFALRAVNTQQRIVEAIAVLPPGSFKPLLRNEGGQAFTSSNTENVLTMEPYTEVQA
jgi:hypothetical protein